MGLMRMLRGDRHERSGFELYTRAVAAARQPWFYTELGVPDTLDGRFDMVGLHVWLLIRHLRRQPPPGPALAQAVFDAMFSDMDNTLRELGVGDLSVGKKVKVMWEALHGRAAAYEAAIDDPDPAVLAEALRRNVWRNAADGIGPARLATVVRAQDASLASMPPGAFTDGTLAFAAAAEASA
jgi:cytochrome b pre-mRNA-processing protein 3